MTPSDAAHVLAVSADTVRALSDNGRLPTLRTVGGRRLFRRGDVEQLAVTRAREGDERKATRAESSHKRKRPTEVKGLAAPAPRARSEE